MGGSRLLVMAVSLWLSTAGPAAAGAGPTPYDRCFEAAGAAYQISPLLLKAIARQESSMRPQAIGRNPDPKYAKEYGIGIMQISSWHLDDLAKLGITEQILLDRPCTNITVGAWMLSKRVRRYGMSWKAVGSYNATTEWKQVRYAEKIQRHLYRELKAAGVDPVTGAK
jgi:soluble lytic murein transglycosylase-like protein